MGGKSGPNLHEPILLNIGNVSGSLVMEFVSDPSDNMILGSLTEESSLLRSLADPLVVKHT